MKHLERTKKRREYRNIKQKIIRQSDQGFLFVYLWYFNQWKETKLSPKKNGEKGGKWQWNWEQNAEQQQCPDVSRWSKAFLKDFQTRHFSVISIRIEIIIKNKMKMHIQYSCRVADPGWHSTDPSCIQPSKQPGSGSDLQEKKPDPAFEIKPDPDTTFKKEKNPNPDLFLPNF